MKPSALLHAALLKHAANLHVPGTGAFRAMNKIPRSVAAGGLAMGAAGAAATTALPGHNAEHGGDKITAENLKRLSDNNAKTQNDLVQGHSKIPGGDPRDSDFIDAKQRSDITRNATSWDQTGKEVSDFQTKGFSPEFAGALGNTKGLGRARQTIGAQENMARGANKARLEEEIISGVNPNQDELRARVGQPPVKKFVPGPEIGADQNAVMADLEKQIAADDGSAAPKAPELPEVAEKKPIEVPSEEPALAEPEVAKAEPGAGEAGAFRVPEGPAKSKPAPEAVAAKPADVPAAPPKNEEAPAAAPAVTPKPDAGPAAPAEKVPFFSRKAWADQGWTPGKVGLAAGGVGAIGLLAYLLSKNEKGPKKRRLSPAARALGASSIADAGLVGASALM